eukprot:CAMPEP_0201208810 /NCGR_PEP_ID=MMETSP0851-20130426/177125_1 /ASSEMBLY_ACC=CAM_ASM_000631 /TAXON_ID=183588 /ORGANISM="Pseudo-nitzschia fraudulenta, Strain WWA7" /LENGTH=835 /DNA_ID=CAMNT_0047497407 /DNA_START=79 /DNA_END=2586 /DNA_ORIENTATION=-
MAQERESFAISNLSPGPTDESPDKNLSDDEPFEESQHTQTQMEFTQLTQPGLTPDESSITMPISASNHTPLSPPPVLPFGRLVPCVPSAKLTAVDLMPTQEAYWLGRSQKCDVTAHFSAETIINLSERELTALEWGKSMISNRHCRIFQQKNGNQVFIEDDSGNGTFINQQTHLRKGETRILHSGDEICLINSETLRKKISSHRIIEMVLQQFSFIVVQSKPRKPCVNPREMNYNFGRNHNGNNKSEIHASPVSGRTATRRIESFYDMREVLGDGTSGQVRRAIHRQSGKERAVKIISLRRHVNTSMIEREVDLLQSLDHPYIVKLVEVFVRQGVAMYLVMELVKGGDLFDCIVKKERYTEVEARRAMRRLLSAIHYLHQESNIVHRDLKPENILCSSPTHVKLADFGLAKIVNSDGLKTFCGTPAYFAPEVLRRRDTVAGQGRYGKPADMWSLGVILYILLIGKHPFDSGMEEESPKNGFEVDFESDALVWANIGHAKNLVEKLLCHDPKRRLTVHEACNHPWINVNDDDTHCHPLDDPAIGTKKRIPNDVLKSNDQNDSDVGPVVTAEADADETGSLSSKDGSILSKEVFIGTDFDPNRSKSVVHVDRTHLSESTKIGASIRPTTIAIQTPKAMISKGETLKHGVTSKVEDPNGGGKQTEISSGEGNDFIDSVSDSACPPPRIPLKNFNINQRSNEFRIRVMKQGNPCQSPLDYPGSDETSNVNGERRTAVTPNSIDTKTVPEQHDNTHPNECDENSKDSILSQFSSDSVESFSDYSANGSPEAEKVTPGPNSNKRLADEDRADRTTEKKYSKRMKTSGSKQTTLNAWLLKKG